MRSCSCCRRLWTYIADSIVKLFVAVGRGFQRSGRLLATLHVNHTRRQSTFDVTLRAASGRPSGRHPTPNRRPLHGCQPPRANDNVCCCFHCFIAPTCVSARYGPDSVFNKNYSTDYSAQKSTQFNLKNGPPRTGLVTVCQDCSGFTEKRKRNQATSYIFSSSSILSRGPLDSSTRWED